MMTGHLPQKPDTFPGLPTFFRRVGHDLACASQVSETGQTETEFFFLADLPDSARFLPESAGKSKTPRPTNPAECPRGRRRLNFSVQKEPSQENCYPLEITANLPEPVNTLPAWTLPAWPENSELQYHPAGTPQRLISSVQEEASQETCYPLVIGPSLAYLVRQAKIKRRQVRRHLRRSNRDLIATDVDDECWLSADVACEWAQDPPVYLNADDLAVLQDTGIWDLLDPPDCWEDFADWEPPAAQSVAHTPAAVSPPAVKLSWADQAELADPADYCPQCDNDALGYCSDGYGGVRQVPGTGPLCDLHAMMDAMMDENDNFIPRSERPNSMLNQWAWQDMQDAAAAAAASFLPPQQPSKRRTRRPRAKRGGQ